ncbi:polysaccharide biosynthesis/export family protein [Synechococcus sp. Nb3U1]|uniref:polysaccharide biosynthesis/export family protein n=1 Tax=Synechococcus sp. Nb3U1 TaxID=1914529 RepID=UPI001F402ADB|nr:polysaccharide biosynthesis/export family protein [Synechococcus sp. Nb3U1]MCF2970793.1 polysaccharide biosynthesis/export family protein [Synechococcus sp. Nb3U1]
MKRHALVLACTLGLSCFPVAAIAAEPQLSLDGRLTWQERAYILGPGDRVRVTVLNEPSLSGDQQVLLDGTLALPLVGTVPVEGMTLQQAAGDLERKFAFYLKYPSVSVSLLDTRGFRINVVGEVTRPGGYTVSPKQGTTGASEVLEVGATTLREDVPRLTQLLQLAGGITQKADIRNIEIRRQTRNGDEQILQVNLWELLQNGAASEDPIIYDGDTIRVPVASQVSPAEISQLSAANFAPDTITINVVGEVTRPGAVSLSPNASLNVAILAAGGFTPKAQQSVELIRLNPDGSVEARQIGVDFAQGISEESNPPLRNSDVIVVRPSGAAQMSDSLDVALNPINILLRPLTSIGNLWRVIDLLTR